MRSVIVTFVLSLPAVATAQPLLSFDGACGGAVDIHGIQITPNGNYAIVSSNGPGAAVIPSGNCAGRALGLSGAGLKLRLTGTADANGHANHSPVIPLAACNAHVVIVDLDACLVSNVATFVPTGDLACSNLGHTAIDQNWRNVDFNDGNGGVENCDAGAAGGAGSYRFMGSGGTLMPETPQLEYDCGTDAPGWINGRHPNAVGGIATVDVCYRWSGNDCNWNNTIRVTNCGPFMVYDLVDPPVSCLAYCTE